jgi:hypothetical protein
MARELRGGRIRRSYRRAECRYDQLRAHRNLGGSGVVTNLPITGHRHYFAARANIQSTRQTQM